MQTVVTVTMNPTLDKSADVYQVAPEQKLRCHTSRFDPGGGGINVARAIQQLGGTASILTLTGGLVGEFLQNLLNEAGLDYQPLPIEGMVRESFTVYEESSGQQYRFNMPGPQIKPHEWQQVLDTVRNLDPAPDYLVASGSLPPGVPADFYAHLTDIADTINARMVVDTTGEPLRAAVEHGVYLIKPNMRELSMVAGKRVESEIEQEHVVTDLVERGASEIVVVSLGAAGALLATDAGCERIRAPSVPIESKVGAGDSMVGGIVFALARGWPVREAVRYGVAAGAAAVMTTGTQLCHSADVERLYSQIQGDAAT